LHQVYGVPVGHAGDPSDETIVGASKVLGALSLRIAWRDHRIDGANLQWTLCDPIETEERPSPGSSSTNLRRPPSPTSSIGQGRAKRQRTDGTASLQGVVQDGLGGTESDPIDVDKPEPSLKRSPRLPSTLPTPPLTGSKQVDAATGLRNAFTSKQSLTKKASSQRLVHVPLFRFSRMLISFLHSSQLLPCGFEQLVLSPLEDIHL
jgi:hypothetical protein